jgi:hypothetical protein
MSEGTKQREAPGARLDGLLRILKREMVGEELLVTGEFTAKVATELGIESGKSHYVYNILQRLEKRGDITRVKAAHGEGITVRFNPNGKPAAAPKTAKKKTAAGRTKGIRKTQTVTGLLAELEAAIKAIDAKIESETENHTRKISELKAERQRKIVLRKEIEALARRES